MFDFNLTNIARFLILAVCMLPLAIWKLIELIILVIKHIHIY